MLLDIVPKDTTGYTCELKIIDSTDGTPETGVVFNTSGIDLWYRREGGAEVSITEVTQTVNGAYSSGGFVHISDGVYRLDLPNAALATGANYVVVGGTVTDMIVIGGRIRLTDVDLNDSVRAGMTALPNVAAGADGGVPLSMDSSGRVDVGEWLGTAVTVSATSAKPEVDTFSVSDDATAANNLEAAIEGTTPMPSNVTQWRGTQPATLSNTYVQVSPQEIANDLITAASIAANAIDASALAADAVTEITDDIMAEVVESEGSYTVQQVLSVILAVLAGQTSSGGATIETPNGNATRVAATVDGSNNRTAMTITPSS